MGRFWWVVTLWVVFSIQLVFAVIAELNEEYTKAIYEMMWAGLFVYLLHGGKQNE